MGRQDRCHTNAMAFSGSQIRGYPVPCRHSYRRAAASDAESESAALFAANIIAAKLLYSTSAMIRASTKFRRTTCRWTGSHSNLCFPRGVFSHQTCVRKEVISVLLSALSTLLLVQSIARLCRHHPTPHVCRVVVRHFGSN